LFPSIYNRVIYIFHPTPNINLRSNSTSQKQLTSKSHWR